MPNIFEAADNNDVTLLDKLIQQGVAVNSRYVIDDYDPMLRVLGYTTLVAKKTIGGGSMAFGTLSLAIGAAGMSLPLIGGVVFFGLFGGVGAAVTWGGDNAVGKITYDKTSWTPLHFAARSNAKEAALFLINHAADTGLKDANGRDFLTIARELGYSEFAKCCECAIAARQQALAQTDNKQIQVTQQLQDVKSELEAARKCMKQLASDNQQYREQNTQLLQKLNRYAKVLEEFLENDKNNENAADEPNDQRFFRLPNGDVQSPLDLQKDEKDVDEQNGSSLAPNASGTIH